MEKHRLPPQKMNIFLSSLFHYEGLEIFNVTIKDRLFALKLMERYKLGYEDAITLQSAISSNSKEILSFDKHFEKIKEVKRVKPAQLINEKI